MRQNLCMRFNDIPLDLSMIRWNPWILIGVNPLFNGTFYRGLTQSLSGIGQNPCMWFNEILVRDSMDSWWNRCQGFYEISVQDSTESSSGIQRNLYVEFDGVPTRDLMESLTGIGQYSCLGLDKNPVCDSMKSLPDILWTPCLGFDGIPLQVSMEPRKSLSRIRWSLRAGLNEIPAQNSTRFHSGIRRNPYLGFDQIPVRDSTDSLSGIRQNHCPRFHLMTHRKIWLQNRYLYHNLPSWTTILLLILKDKCIILLHNLIKLWFNFYLV